MIALSDPWLLLYLQIAAHVALISMLFWATSAYWLLMVVGYFFTSCVGISVGYHRLFTHRSFVSPKWFEKLCVHLGNLGGIGSSMSWVATHRAHHHYSDQSDKDPHSPHHHAWYRVIWLSMFEPVHIRYVKDLLRSPMHVWWHKHYFSVHLAVLCGLMLINPWVAISLYLAPLALNWSMGGVLNWLNHQHGYKSHQTEDHSTNNWVFGLLYWGEGWHNNHHANPKSYQFGETWWEVDVGAWIINLIKKC